MSTLHDAEHIMLIHCWCSSSSQILRLAHMATSVQFGRPTNDKQDSPAAVWMPQHCARVLRVSSSSPLKSSCRSPESKPMPQELQASVQPAMLVFLHQAVVLGCYSSFCKAMPSNFASAAFMMIIVYEAGARSVWQRLILCAAISGPAPCKG